MKAIFLFVWSILLFAQAVGAAEQKSTQVFERMKGDFTISSSDQATMLSYCPDNLCLLIEYPSDVDDETIADFALVFFYESGWPEFRDKYHALPSGNNVSEELLEALPNLTKKYRNACGGDVTQDYGCIVKHMKRTFAITAYFSRQDEGHYSIEEVNP